MALTKYFLPPELEARLLNIGGKTIYLTESLKAWRQTEESTNQTAPLLERGKEFDGANAVMVPGDTGLCHANTAALYFIAHGHIEIWTGWALNDIGGWTEHSWGRYAGQIYDSAGKWFRYFGFTPAKQREWAESELGKAGRLREDSKDYIGSCFSADSKDLLTKIFDETLIQSAGNQRSLETE